MSPKASNLSVEEELKPASFRALAPEHPRDSSFWAPCESSTHAHQIADTMVKDEIFNFHIVTFMRNSLRTQSGCASVQARSECGEPDFLLVRDLVADDLGRSVLQYPDLASTQYLLQRMHSEKHEI